MSPHMQVRGGHSAPTIAGASLDGQRLGERGLCAEAAQNFRHPNRRYLQANSRSCFSGLPVEEATTTSSGTASHLCRLCPYVDATHTESRGHSSSLVVHLTNTLLVRSVTAAFSGVFGTMAACLRQCADGVRRSAQRSATRACSTEASERGRGFTISLCQITVGNVRRVGNSVRRSSHAHLNQVT